MIRFKTRNVGVRALLGAHLNIVALVLAMSVLAVVAWGASGQYGGLASPAASVAATIGGKRITIEYYAPSMRGRKIMDGLVPFGEVWSTGANYATKISTEGNLEMGGLKVAAGTYSIWTIPNQNEWTLIINKQTGQSHLDYEASEDFGRAKMTVKTLAAPVETFRIELRAGAGNKGTLALLWETTEASISLTVVP